jgi:hypothetical protein
MGNFCATDVYKDIKEKYPQDFEKYIIGEEMKKILNDKLAAAQTGIAASVG